MVSTEWGEPFFFASGFNPEHVAAGIAACETCDTVCYIH
jgi:hypothetical protein